MVQLLKNKRGAVARFGAGLIKISQYTLKTRFGGQIELVETDVPNGSVIPDTNKIVLDFATVKSIDTMIRMLQDLKEGMIEEQG